MKSQKYAHLNTTYAMTTLVDMPTWMGESHEVPPINGNYWHLMVAERRRISFFQDKPSDRIDISCLVSSPKHMYIQASVKRLSRLYIYVLVCMCVQQ